MRSTKAKIGGKKKKRSKDLSLGYSRAGQGGEEAPAEVNENAS